MINLLAVFVGGGIGASLRYVVTEFSKKLIGCSILGTFAVNILGCFLIGLVSGLIISKSNIMPSYLKVFITVGFLGGLTTFSTFSNESLCFIKDGKLLYALIYMILSLVFGLFAAYLGYLITK